MPDQAGHDRKRQSSLRFSLSSLCFFSVALTLFSVILAFFLRHPCAREDPVSLPFSSYSEGKDPGCPIGAGHDRSGHPYVFLPHPCIFFLSSLRTRGSSVVVLCRCPGACGRGCAPVPSMPFWRRGLSELALNEVNGPSEGTLNQRPTTYKKQILHCVQNDNLRFFLGATPGRHWFWVLLPKQKGLVVWGRNPTILLPSSRGDETPHPIPSRTGCRSHGTVPNRVVQSQAKTAWQNTDKRLDRPHHQT